jgi:hypothetical protein
MTTTFEVPVIVCVVVEQADDGTLKVVGANVDSESAPWPFSGDPCAYDATNEMWHDDPDWCDTHPDDEERELTAEVWCCAYDSIGPIPLHEQTTYAQPEPELASSTDHGAS